MRLARFFIARPVFAAVISIAITLIGAIAGFRLPISEYPEIAPPTVTVTATYPGASAQVISETVATPLEQEINGVDNMLYISSQATGDGKLTINVVFRQGTDVDQAQVLVQNRTAVALPRLPEEVQRLGIVVRKASPDLLMVVHMLSPDDSRDQQYISNYATINVKDRLARLDGVGDAQVFGARDYAMRIWLDPARIAARGLTPGEVVAALRRANLQVAAGGLNQPPTADNTGQAFQINVQALGRLLTPEQFGEIVITTGTGGAPLRVKDVARVELGSQDYTVNALLNNKVATAIVIYQRPGSNALATADAVRSTMEELSRSFPSGLTYSVVYDPTRFIAQSMEAVTHTFAEAVVLVVLVVILFLQSWRAAIIPLLAIPVSIIGTFAFLGALGLSLNTLSMFGLILAIGIVVDDAIVVVENVERHLADGMPAREAAERTMDEVGFALIAIALVLCAVFVPTAFIEGIAGAFYRQFAVTIAVATLLSALVSLTLSPALAALLLKPHGHGELRGPWRLLFAPFGLFFRGFNRLFDALSFGYGALTRRLVRFSAVLLVLYAGLLGLTGHTVQSTPTGLIPPLDRGYLIAAFQLPPGASLARTDAVIRRASETVLQIPGVKDAVAFVGFDGATFTNAPNTGVIFLGLQPFEERVAHGISYPALIGEVQRRLGEEREALALVIPPPSVPGIGTGGGFKLYVQDRTGQGARALEQATGQIVGAANGLPEIAMAFTLFNTSTPTLRTEVDRTKAEVLGVPLARVSETLSYYLGSIFVNDFNILGRTYRVTAQAEENQRRTPRDVALLRTRNDDGEMVPIGALAEFRDDTAPYRVPRYNLYPAAEIQGAAKPGVSTGQAIAAMQKLLAERLPEGFGYEWTEIALQETQQGNTAPIAFGLAVVFVFLLLAALYESWLLPLAVVLIAPMSVLAALAGVLWRGLDNNVLVQVGLVVLVGLAAKNAILIVEFARAAEAEGMTRWEAAAAAARTRLRPILMTSLAFILGVLPLAVATGAGAEMRQSLGTAVFAGMLGVTGFGLLFTPVFYVVARAMARKRKVAAGHGAAPHPAH
ncbi:multidrug efflux RND transporter permease subunit [Siccirubricoccus sp. KC 17139]|uniref:Efflux pump membrane transporter n=1 Tax=Siccirubricoccus soli TaxID=2899147 RepID=A0ABT1DEG0_9PROT|nr:multidrug efflux RND transporter permease subunit [Siccirubricoccus soli]MCO6419355.1 multidrug efflux RND transporter permease subunit [Siccirubricoccus soli]MCP2685490.1 multidrug efflux RND transporter permease subunit [Siccirubricoccus soli]